MFLLPALFEDVQYVHFVFFPSVLSMPSHRFIACCSNESLDGTLTLHLSTDMEPYCAIHQAM